MFDETEAGLEETVAFWEADVGLMGDNVVLLDDAAVGLEMTVAFCDAAVGLMDNEVVLLDETEAPDDVVEFEET